MSKALKALGFTRAIISGFLLVLFVTAAVSGLDVVRLLSDSLVRFGMNLLLVIALIPPIRGGLGLNFGLPVGICAGLFGMVVAVETGLSQWPALAVALVVAIPLAVLGGIGYAWLLERVRGQEMMVGTYVGFSAVAFMCMVWLMAPFRNPEMVWALGGKGLRVTISLSRTLGSVLDGFLAFRMGNFVVPTGLLLFCAAACFLLRFYLNSSSGLALLAAGQNPLFARSCGVDVRAHRQRAMVASTLIAATGIIVYAQSFGFLQLYLAPLMMAFPSVASILIGGATVRHATIANAVIGTALFQTLLVVALPVTQQLIHGNISEVARVLVSNGMILYALTRAYEE